MCVLCGKKIIVFCSLICVRVCMTYLFMSSSERVVSLIMITLCGHKYGQHCFQNLPRQSIPYLRSRSLINEHYCWLNRKMWHKWRECINIKLRVLNKNDAFPLFLCRPRVHLPGQSILQPPAPTDTRHQHIGHAAYARTCLDGPCHPHVCPRAH